MSNFPQTPSSRPGVLNAFGPAFYRHPSENNSTRHQCTVNQQIGPAFHSASPVTGLRRFRGPHVQGSSPLTSGAGPMAPPGKRPADDRNQPPVIRGDFLHNIQVQNNNIGMNKRKKKVADETLPRKVRNLVPESEAYMNLLGFEKDLDSMLARKRLDIEDALKRPMTQKRKLCIFISNAFYPTTEPWFCKEGSVTFWELRIEGRLLEDLKIEPSQVKRKFSSFFTSMVIDLGIDLYGPHNHLVKWQRTSTTQETDGFQVKRPGDKNVHCTISLFLDYQPLQFKLDQRLAKILGIRTETKQNIINALWQFIKTHKLQDSQEKEYINCGKYLGQIFNCSRMKFYEIPQRLNSLLHSPDPIVINHIISVDGTKQKVCYDIDVDVDDTLKAQMNKFLVSTSNQQEIQSLDCKMYETIEKIKQLQTNREFFMSFAEDPQQLIYKWNISQTNDLKTMTDVVGNPEEERRAEFYYQPWVQEAVNRYLYSQVHQKRAEFEHQLGTHDSQNN